MRATEAGQRWAPWWLSALIHASLIAGSFFVVWTVLPADDPPADPVTVRFEDPAPPPPSRERAETPEDALQLAPDPPPTTPSPERPEPLELETPAPGPPEPPALAETETPPPVEIAPERLDADFAGAGASEARDIVYVVDASGSTIAVMPAILAELRRSIDRLHPTQRFQVLLVRTDGGDAFAFPPVPNPTERPILIDALASMRRAVFAWLEGVAPSGASDVVPAIEAALAMEPDAVFVLARLSASDLTGRTPEQTMARLDALNPVDPRSGERPVTIKTIQLIDEDETGLMRAIGSAHGGEDGYNFIGRDEVATLQRAEDG